MQEIKHGRYEKFDISKASWMCPACRKDTLILKPYNNGEQFTFVCAACGFDSKDYAISVKKSGTYNRVHRWLVKEWPWIRYLTEKWAIIGMEMLKMELEKKDECGGDCSHCKLQ